MIKTQDISHSLQTMKRNYRLYEGLIITKEKEKIDSIVRNNTSRSVHQKLVSPKKHCKSQKNEEPTQ
jgi:hypothetical protein